MMNIVNSVGIWGASLSTWRGHTATHCNTLQHTASTSLFHVEREAPHIASNEIDRDGSSADGSVATIWLSDSSVTTTWLVWQLFDSFDAVCCSVLQCVAASCSVLHCVAVRCSALWQRFDSYDNYSTRLTNVWLSNGSVTTMWLVSQLFD